MSTKSALAFQCLLLITTTLLGSHVTSVATRKSHSLVLGLRHSRATFSTRKAKPISFSAKKQSEPFEMREPLRAVRDGFVVPLYVGTPPKAMQVYMDTGSDLTWVPCGDNLSFECMDCDDYRNSKVITPFSPSSSSSSRRDLCGSSFCIAIHSSDNDIDPCTMAGCSLSALLKSSCARPCPSFAYTYGASGVVAGVLARDTLRVHQSISSPNITKEIPDFLFGCVGSTYKEPIGIAGFGRGPLSLPSQLGFLRKGFSHCFLPFKFANKPDMSSPLVIGDSALSSSHEENLQYTPMLKSPMYPSYYYVGLESITVGDSVTIDLPLSMREFDSQGNGGMLIDSGTTYTHLPEPVYSQLLSKLHSMITFSRAQDTETRTGFDLCYQIPYNTSSTTTEELDLLPSITFSFLNNVRLVLFGESHFYAMGPPQNSTVVKCLLFQSMENGDYGPAGVFGNFQQQNVKVVYDLEKERIGLQRRDCASSAISHQNP